MRPLKNPSRNRNRTGSFLTQEEKMCIHFLSVRWLNHQGTNGLITEGHTKANSCFFFLRSVSVSNFFWGRTRFGILSEYSNKIMFYGNIYEFNVLWEYFGIFMGFFFLEKRTEFLRVIYPSTFQQKWILVQILAIFRREVRVWMGLIFLGVIVTTHWI